MFDEMLILRGEICTGGRYIPTAGASAINARPELAGAEVGVGRISNEAGNDRGAKGPHLVGVCRGAGDR